MQSNSVNSKPLFFSNIANGGSIFAARIVAAAAGDFSLLTFPVRGFPLKTKPFRQVFPRNIVAGLVALAAACLSVAAPSSAVAQQTLYWSGTTGTSAPLWTTLAAWSTLPGSWSPPAEIPGATNNVVFNISPLTTSQDVYLDGNQYALGLTFSSPAATTLRGGSAGSPAANTVTTGTGGITVAGVSGPVVIGTGSSDNVNVVLGGSQTWNVLNVGGLTVRGGVAGSAAAGAAQTLTIAATGVTSGGPTQILGVVSDGAGGGVLNIAKSGVSPLWLANTANTYSGSTSINRGAIVISGSGSLGTGTSTVTISGNGGALYLAGGQTPFTLSRNLSLTGPGGIQSIGANTISGAISASNSSANRISSAFDRLTLSGSLNLATDVSLGMAVLTSTFVLAPREVRITGTIAGAGKLLARQNGNVWLDPTETTGWSGGFGDTNNALNNIVLITRNNVVGNNTVGIGTNQDFVVRMDDPMLQTASGGNANVSFSNGGGANLRVDHGVGTLDWGKTLTVGNWSGPVAGSSRNGYNLTVGNWTNGSGNVAGITGGLFTISGTVTSGLTTVGGNTLLQGNLRGGASNGLSVGAAGAYGGMLTVSSTSGSIGSVQVISGVLAITDFRSIGNVSTGTISLASAANATESRLIIGTTGSPGSAADLTSERVLSLDNVNSWAQIYASQSGTNPVVFPKVSVKDNLNKDVLLGGTSTLDNLISGNIGNGPAGTLALYKTGPGTWVLSGTNTFTGATSIRGGTLKLNATAGASTVFADTAAINFNADPTVGSAGGTLAFNGFLNTTTTESVGALTPTAGAGNVVVSGNGGGSTTLTFASLGSRGADATLNYAPGSNASIVVTTTTGLVTNGILGSGTAYQTFRGTDWATLTSGTIAAFTGYTTLPTSAATSTVNYSLSADTTVSAAMSVNTLKLTGSGTPPTLTLGGTLTLTARGLLFDNSSGGATISGTGQLGSTNNELIVYTGGSGTSGLTINAAIGSGTAWLTKSGAGLLVIGGSNAFTGNTIISEGTVRLSGATATLGAITNPANTTTLRQGSTLDINAAGPSQTVTIGALSGNGTITNSGGGAATAGTLSIGQGTTTTANGTFAGVLQDGPGGGVLNVTKNGTGQQYFRGLSTYTGVTRINSGTLAIDVLANGGTASSIGQSTSAAANLVFNGNGVLAYAGVPRLATADLTVGFAQTSRTDRLFTLEGTGTATIASNVGSSNALIWTNTGAIAHSGAAARTINLAGSSAGDNTFAPQITDSGTGSNVTSVLKSGAGIWWLTGTNNTYSGPTTVAEGVLGALGGLPANSPLQLGVTGSTGTLLMSGTLSRTVAASAVNGQATITLGGATTGGAGFAASGTSLVVAFQQSGSLQPLTWGSDGFLGTSGTLSFGSSTGFGVVDFQNSINLNAAARTVTVADNTLAGMDFARISGPISGSGGATGLVKIGSGWLELAGNNTYSGSTSVTAGGIVVRSLGNSTTASASSSVGAFAAGDAGAITLNGGNLQYVGDGETSDRRIRLASDASLIVASAGPLVLNDVQNAAAGGKTLTVNITNAFDTTIGSNLLDNGGALNVTLNTVDQAITGATGNSLATYATGRLILTGSNNSAGTLRVANGSLGIGSDSAVNFRTLHLGSVSVDAGLFAVGADRIVPATTNITVNRWASGAGNHITFFGDYSLTLNGTISPPAGEADSGNIFNNNIVQGKSLTLNGNIVTATTSATTWTFAGSGNTYLNGSFLQSGTWTRGLTKAGSGRLYLTGSNVYTGITAVNAGVLSIAGTNSLPGWNVHGRVTGAAGAALVVGNNVSDADFNTIRTTGSASYAGNFMVGFDTGTNAAFERIYSSTPLANTGANVLGFMKIGSGTLSMNVANTYTGTTAINEGVLRLGIAGALPSGSPVLVANSGGLDVGVNSTTSGTVTVSGTASSIFGTGTLSAASYTFTNAAGTSSASAVLAGAAATFTKSGGGTTVLSAANTYAGKTSVSEGVLEFSSIANVSSGASNLGAPTTPGNGTIDLGSGTTAGTLRYTGSGTSSSNRVVNLAGSAGGGGVIEATGAGPLVLTGSVTAAAGAKTLTLGGSSTADNAISAIINGSGTTSVVKDGSGLWRLPASSSFSGGFTLKNGTVIADVSSGGQGQGGAFGSADTVTVGDSTAGAAGTAALLLSPGVLMSKNLLVPATTGTQAVLLGGSGTGSSPAFTNNGIQLNRAATLVAVAGGTADFSNTWTIGTGVNVAVGTAAYAGTVLLKNSLATTGAVNVRFGRLDVTSQGTLTAGSGLSIDAPGTLVGSGVIAATLGGAGLVAPGNSPGILTAGAVDPSGGLDFNFEFTGTGSPTYDNAAASVNDVLRITGSTPFTSSLSGSNDNVVNVYLSAGSLVGGEVFRGGFYTDTAADFFSSVKDATFNYWVAGSGTHIYNSGTYVPLATYNSALTMSLSTVPQTTGTFGNGDPLTGQVTQFTVVVPEPGTLALAALGLGLVGYAIGRRRRAL